MIDKYYQLKFPSALNDFSFISLLLNFLLNKYPLSFHVKQTFNGFSWSIFLYENIKPIATMWFGEQLGICLAIKSSLRVEKLARKFSFKPRGERCARFYHIVVLAQWKTRVQRSAFVTVYLQRYKYRIFSLKQLINAGKYQNRKNLAIFHS